MDDIVDDTGGIFAQVTLGFFILITSIWNGHIASLDNADVFARIPDGNHFILVNDMGRKRYINDAAFDAN